MNFTDFWSEAIAQNPGLTDRSGILMDVEKFRNALEVAFEAGRMAGDDAGYERGLRAAESRTMETAVGEAVGDRGQRSEIRDQRSAARGQN